MTRKTKLLPTILCTLFSQEKRKKKPQIFPAKRAKQSRKPAEVPVHRVSFAYLRRKGMVLRFLNLALGKDQERIGEGTMGGHVR